MCQNDTNSPIYSTFMRTFLYFAVSYCHNFITKQQRVREWILDF